MSTDSANVSEAEGFVTLHVPSRYSYLRVIRQSIVDMCARAGASELTAAQLEMAVDEACANIIEHSYGGNSDTPSSNTELGLRVNLIHFKEKLVVEMYDFGKGFDFEAYTFPEPDEYIENKQDRGLGMYIINQFVDGVEYLRGTPSGNRLILSKKIV